MKERNRSMKLGSFLFVFLMLIGSLPAQADETSLGFGLTIIPVDDGSDAKLTLNNKLWFGIEQGGSLTRSFQVSSASEIPQRLNFEVFDVIIDNGVSTIRTDKKSDTAPWVTFTPATLVLPPGQTGEVKMNYQIPVGTPDASYDAFLRVIATAANPPEVQENSEGVRVVMAGGAAIDTSLWLGVGDPTNLITDFEIDDLTGVLIDGAPALRITFSNTGKTPIGPKGNVQLQDPAFQERNFGPFIIGTPEIAPGERVYVDIALPAEVTDGFWRSFVVAEQGNIRKSRAFESELTFKVPVAPIEPSESDDPSAPFPWQYILIPLLLLVFFLGWRLIRTSKGSSRVV